MTTPCSLGLPNLNSPSLLHLFLSSSFYLCGLYVLVLTLFRVQIRSSFAIPPRRPFGLLASHKTGSPASFFPFPLLPLPIFLATSTLFILLVHTFPPPQVSRFPLSFHLLPFLALLCDDIRVPPWHW
ncbi:hypothetical protein GGI35DRAFT_459819 [Trichoderma velutinum]